jgi:hypothetical protein
MKKPIRFILVLLTAVWVCSVAGAQAKAPQPSCKERPEFRQLDFWIGEWDVFNKDQKIAEVSIQPVLKDCALEEFWKSPRGNDGKGLSTYNPRSQKWEYFWVAANGSTSYFSAGELSGNEMRYPREQVQPDGKVRSRRWSLFNLPDGRVRELSVGSDDGGKTWNTEYDYYWRKK